MSAGVEAHFERERLADGYVSNHTRLWAWRNEIDRAFTGLRSMLADATTLTARERAAIVCATASRLGDSYCSLAWGARFAALAGAPAAAAILCDVEAADITERERALAIWARRVVAAPNETTQTHVDELREAGFNDQQIFDATLLVAFRLAFSTVNDALGAQPDARLAAAAPAEVRAAVTFGRPVAASETP